MTSITTALLTSLSSPEPETASASFTLDAGLVAAIISAAVAITVAFLTPVFHSWRQRRDTVSAKFDAAVGALLLVQIARYYASGVTDGVHPGTDAERSDFKRRVVEQGLSRFIDLTNAARASLADIAPYVPEAHGWITSGWEISETDAPGMRDVIDKARPAAIKTERLLRRRKVA